MRSRSLAYLRSRLALHALHLFAVMGADAAAPALIALHLAELQVLILCSRTPTAFSSSHTASFAAGRAAGGAAGGHAAGGTAYSSGNAHGGRAGLGEARKAQLQPSPATDSFAAIASWDLLSAQVRD